MKRIKKKIFLGFNATLLVVLGTIRQCNPDIMPAQMTAASLPKAPISAAATHTPSAEVKYHPLYRVTSFEREFPDPQDTQIVAARQWGVSPVLNRVAAEQRKDELVYIASHPYFVIDKRMKSSIPYLVPRASELLQTIGRNFLDSLAVKGMPLHRVLVTSVLRTQDDVEKLRRKNVNASDQSCHLFGTTFDISYKKFETVAPAGQERFVEWNDSLRFVLCEVLRDLRKEGRCYVKYEVKQPCFHITTR